MADGNMFSVKKGLFALTLFPHSPVLPVPSMCMTGVCMFVCVVEIYNHLSLNCTLPLFIYALVLVYSVINTSFFKRTTTVIFS